jgi:hypothetical protein
MGFNWRSSPSEPNRAHRLPVGRSWVVQGGRVDFSLLGRMGRAHWATIGPVTLSAQLWPNKPLTADVNIF